MAYIKSHSNYVVKKRHQDIDGGNIFERDFTTIGGSNRFSKGQLPIYNSGNFVITVREDESMSKDYSSEEWLSNDNGEVWSYTDIQDSISQKDDSLSIVLKQDYYKLKDFAYYGSCSELIRASITDIVNRFPGELYAVPNPNGNGKEGIKVYKTNGDYYSYAPSNRITCEFLIDNPFDVNLHTSLINKNETENVLKYLCNNGWENYEYIDANGKSHDIVGITIIPRMQNDCSWLNTIQVKYKTSAIASKTEIIVSFKAENGQILYLASTIGWRIRPKVKFYNDFIKSLDSFQKQLLNTSSKPKYTACFEIIRENSFGFYKELQNFTFPTTFGGYNLAVNDTAYSSYIDSLIEIGNFYDLNFCDNLYKNLTHESLKNFDWSYKQEYDDDLTEEHILGGTKFQKLIRLIGREFDEIKFYIDGISYSNTLTYDEGNNMPNYFLTDSLNNEGWDVVNIFPYDDNGKKDETSIVMPYKNNDDNYYGYFIDKNGDRNEATKDSNYIIECGKNISKIIEYFSQKEYNMSEINDKFLQRLRLNSRNIFSHKGTVEGIEMVLGLFGLRSKRWWNSYTDGNSDTEDFDFDIVEEVQFSDILVDSGITIDKKNVTIDEINQTKLFVYDTEEFRNGIYIPYQGLPVKAYITDGKTELVPFFDKTIIIDGNPYYQMNGGWFCINDGEITSYKETIKDIISVDNIKNLFLLSKDKLHDNIIVHVKDTNGKFIIINGVLYDIFDEFVTNIENKDYIEYISVKVVNNSIKVGNSLFDDEIEVSNPKYENGLEVLSLNDYDDGEEVRIYITEDDRIIIESNTEDMSSEYWDITYYQKDEQLSNYFVLDNVDDKRYLATDGSNGWMQLTVDESKQKIDSLKNYFGGNNPHCGRNRYDGGEEYLDYFREIFKFALKEKAFDENCFGNNVTLDKVVDDIKQNFIGFYLQYISSQIPNKIIHQNKYEDYNIKYSEQIVNVKNVTLTFYLTENNEKTRQYYIDVIMNYVSQMIPSNTILNIYFYDKQQQ